MKVMIVGGNFRGKGAEAMMLTIIRELAARVSEISFLVQTCDKEPVPSSSVEFLEAVPVFFEDPPWSFSDYAFLAISWLLGMDRWSRLRQYRQIAAQAVAVLDISGYSFTPKGRLPGRTASYHSARLAMTRLAGAQHIVLPQVMGPIRGHLDRWLARRALSLASSITVRDEVTRSILDDIGLTATKSVSVCPDIAFLFPAAPEDRARQILTDVGMGDTPFVVVTPNMRVYERSPILEGRNVYLDTLVRLIQDIVEGLNVAVLLIPHEFNPRADDDSWLVDRIAARLGDCRQVFKLGDHHTAADIKSVIGRAQMAVGSRYHSLIAALSMRVPCLAISWSHKYETLMESVGLGDCVFRIDDLNYSSLRERVFDLWAERERVPAELDRIVAGFERDVNGLLDQTAQLIAKACGSQSPRGSGR